MTFFILRALHGIIGEALDEIEAIYALHDSQNKPAAGKENIPDKPGCLPSGRSDRPHHRPALSINSLSNVYVSPPPSPCIKTDTSYDSCPLDFPSLDAYCDPSSLSEMLTQHPDVIAAINRIIAACGQMTATVQTPFLTICDATMSYHLPSCMRLFEASHTPEILREAGLAGLHVDLISEKNGVNKTKLAHTLRLLATHHIVKELSPDVFALNRISSTIDTGNSFQDIQRWTTEGVTEKKYEGTSGVAAFVGLCSDEIFKSSAHMTDTYLLSQSEITRAGTDPTKAPFCFAFGTVESQIGYFGWLDGLFGDQNLDQGSEETRLEAGQSTRRVPVKKDASPYTPGSVRPVRQDLSISKEDHNPNRFRLERFGKAMSGTSCWETPGAILKSFDWHSLPRRSVIVDVGGGIGSTSMLLASAFSSVDDSDLDLRFIIQDRPIVVEMGEKAWTAKCPEFLENGTALFQVHDFFTPQPVKQAAVFLLRVVLHDWPDNFARRILVRLREAATPDTKLLLGDFILPLACPDETGDVSLEGIQGIESVLASPPLLSNLGKASANAYWMDMTMQVVFNAQERTLREIVALAASAGWRVTRVTTCISSLFGWIVAVPTIIPSQNQYQAAPSAVHRDPAFRIHQGGEDRTNELGFERSSSRSGTPTFGSRMQLSFVEEALSKFGGGILRSRKFGSARPAVSPRTSLLKQSITLKPVPPGKKKPSTLSIPPFAASPTLSSPSMKGFPSLKQSLQSPGQKSIPRRRLSFANLRSPPFTHEPPPSLPTLPSSLAPPLPRSPHQRLPRKSSLAKLPNVHGQTTPSSSGSASPNLSPTRQFPEPSSPSTWRQEREASGHASGIPMWTSPPMAAGRWGNDGRDTQSPPKTFQSQIRSMGRRSSSAQLQTPEKSLPPLPLQTAAKIELRKRTKSVAGLFSRASQNTANRVASVASETEPFRANGLDSRIGMVSSRPGGLLIRSGGGTNLRQEKERDVAMPRALPEVTSFVDADWGTSVVRDKWDFEEQRNDNDRVNILAAAAMIEKKVPRKKESP